MSDLRETLIDMAITHGDTRSREDSTYFVEDVLTVVREALLSDAAVEAACLFEDDDVLSESQRGWVREGCYNSLTAALDAALGGDDMSDRDMTRARFGYDDMDADRLNEYAEEVARLRAQVGRLQDAARKAHDAMTNWHFVHGEPSALMSPEEAEMGEACKTIAALLDEEPPQRQEISVHCDQCGGQWFWPTFNGELHLQTCHEHSDPPERDDGYTGPRIYVGGSEIRPFRDIVEDDDAR